MQRLTQVKDKLLFQSLSAGLVGTWRWDIIENKVFTDQALANMFGVDEKAAEDGLPLDVFVDSIHEDDKERVSKAIKHTLKTAATYEQEYRIVSTMGAERWVIARGKVDVDEKTGRSTVFLGVMIDISDRKHAEEAERAVSEQLYFMADSMPQLVWVSPPSGTPEYYNKRWYEFTGMSAERPEGADWGYILHPEDRALTHKVWNKSLKSGEPYEVEYRLYHAPTKTYRWVIGRAMPFKDDNGKIVKWYGTCTDIDEQKRASQIQSFLADASKELASSLDYTETLDKVTKLCVPEIADWCTVDLYDEVKGFEQVSVAHSDPKKIALAREYRSHNPIDADQPTGVAAVIRTGEMEVYPYIDEAMLRKYIKETDKLEFMLSLNLHSIIIAPIIINGKTTGAISFVSSESGRYYTQTDLYMAEEAAARISLAITNTMLYTESVEEIKRRKKLEKDLREEKEKLESRVEERTQELDEYSKNLARSNQELENFAYVASHDLQEPLRKIQAFGNLLESEYSEQLGTDGVDYLKRMRSAASRMSTLIQDLLAFSRVSTKQNPKVDVDLNMIVEEVLGDLETLTTDVGGTVSVNTLPRVKADPTHMRQLFQNLIGNALKFNRPGVSPIVDVSAKENDDTIEISVKDNGIGFDEKYLDRIFSVFQRLHDRDSYEGTGIGLAVCRKIAERYDGSITATSKKNKGSTFIVRLPKTIKEKK